MTPAGLDATSTNHTPELHMPQRFFPREIALFATLHTCFVVFAAQAMRVSAQTDEGLRRVTGALQQAELQRGDACRDSDATLHYLRQRRKLVTMPVTTLSLFVV